MAFLLCSVVAGFVLQPHLTTGGSGRSSLLVSGSPLRAPAPVAQLEKFKFPWQKPEKDKGGPLAQGLEAALKDAPLPLKVCSCPRHVAVPFPNGRSTSRGIARLPAAPSFIAPSFIAPSIVAPSS